MPATLLVNGSSKAAARQSSSPPAPVLNDQVPGPPAGKTSSALSLPRQTNKSNKSKTTAEANPPTATLPLYNAPRGSMQSSQQAAAGGGAADGGGAGDGYTDDDDDESGDEGGGEDLIVSNSPQ